MAEYVIPMSLEQGIGTNSTMEGGRRPGKMRRIRPGKVGTKKRPSVETEGRLTIACHMKRDNDRLL